MGVTAHLEHTRVTPGRPRLESAQDGRSGLFVGAAAKPGWCRSDVRPLSEVGHRTERCEMAPATSCHQACSSSVVARRMRSRQ